MVTAPLAHVWRPSCARRVILDGFVPVPRGTVAATPAPLSWPVKDPSDVLDYELDFSAGIVGNPGDPIATITVVTLPANLGDLVVNSVAADGAIAVIWMAAGQSGTTYSVQVTAVTSAGRTISRVILLPVLSLTTTGQPTSAISTTQGTVITDQNGNPILIGN